MTDERYFPEEAAPPPSIDYRVADANAAERRRGLGLVVPDVVADPMHTADSRVLASQRLGAFVEAFAGTEQSMPLITALMVEAEQHTSSPQELIFPCILGAGAIGGQGGYDVQIENESPSSISLILKLSGTSGIGKTPCFHYILGCINDWVKTENERHQEELQDAMDLLEAWESERDGINLAIRKNRAKGHDVSSQKRELQAHKKLRPKEPKAKIVLVADSTQEALMEVLSDSCTVGVASSEAERIINGPLMRNIGLFTEAWDGFSLDRWRVTGKKGQVDGPRLTVLLLGQQEAFDEHHRGKGAKGGYLGFHARTLFLRSQAKPESRTYFEGEKDTIATSRFQARIRQLLTESFEAHSAGQPRKVLKLSPEAVTRWKQIRKIINLEMAKGGCFENTQDFASKLIINIVRVAAVIHLIEGFEGDISLSTLSASHRICQVFSAQYLEIFMPQHTRRHLMDALDKELDEFRKGGVRLVAKSYFTSYATISALRKPPHLHSAANGLMGLGKISVISYKGVSCIDLWPRKVLGPNEPIWKRADGKFIAS